MPIRVSISIKAKRRLQGCIDVKKVNFIEGDIFECDFSKYDIFYVNQGWDDEYNESLKSKFIKESKFGSVFILYDPSDKLVLKSFNLLKDFNVYKDGWAGKIRVYKKVKQEN